MKIKIIKSNQILIGTILNLLGLALLYILLFITSKSTVIGENALFLSLYNLFGFAFFNIVTLVTSKYSRLYSIKINLILVFISFPLHIIDNQIINIFSFIPLLLLYQQINGFLRIFKNNYYVLNLSIIDLFSKLIVFSIVNLISQTPLFLISLPLYYSALIPSIYGYIVYLKNKSSDLIKLPIIDNSFIKYSLILILYWLLISYLINFDIVLLSNNNFDISYQVLTPYILFMYFGRLNLNIANGIFHQYYMENIIQLNKILKDYITIGLPIMIFQYSLFIWLKSINIIIQSNSINLLYPLQIFNFFIIGIIFLSTLSPIKYSSNNYKNYLILISLILLYILIYFITLNFKIPIIISTNHFISSILTYFIFKKFPRIFNT